MPSLRGAASGNSGSASALTATAVMPAAAVAGDLLIIQVACERNTIIPTLSGISGLTTIKSEAGNGMTHIIAQKRLVSGDLGVTVTATVTSGRRFALGLTVMQNAADPVWVHKANDLNTVGATTAIGPDGTTTVASSSLLALHNLFPNASPWIGAGTPESGWTEVLDNSSQFATAANGHVYAALKNTVASGVTDGHTVTYNIVKPEHFSSLAIMAPAAAPGVVVLTSRTDVVELNYTGSTGTVSLAQTSGPAVTITQPTTGNFRVVMPSNRTAAIVLTATASGTPAATATVTIGPDGAVSGRKVRVAGTYV